MKRSTFLLFCTTLIPLGAPQITEGQEAEAQLQQVEELHIKPSMVAQFEAAHADRLNRMKEAGVTFIARGAVSEAHVYRFVTPVGDLAGLQRLVDQMGKMGRPSASVPSGSDAIDHIDSYMRMTRPDLSYTPQNPRLQTSEWKAMHRMRIFAQQGKVGEVIDAIGDVTTLYREHDVPDGFLVYVQVVGPDAPLVEVQFFSSSMADIYRDDDPDPRVEAAMVDIRKRVDASSRRVERDNFMIRSDLSYQPPN